mgnify:CR=1 FL=1
MQRCAQLDQLLSPPGESAKDLEAERERRKKEAKRRKAKRKADDKRGAKAQGQEGEVEEDEGAEEGEWDVENGVEEPVRGGSVRDG